MPERQPTATSAALPMTMAAFRGKRPTSSRPSSRAPSELTKNAQGERKRRQLYGRRKGPKLSAHQSALFETLLPQLALKLEQERDPRDYFSANVDDIWLEVGFGGGEHLLWQAEHHPNIGTIGAEPYEAGVAKLLSKVALSPSVTTRCARATPAPEENSAPPLSSPACGGGV